MVYIWRWRASEGLDAFNAIRENPPKAVLSIETLDEEVWVKSTITDDRREERADAHRYRDVGQITDGWFGGVMELPEDFTVTTGNHCTLFQLHAGSISPGVGAGRFLTLIAKRDGSFTLRRRMKPNPREDIAEGIYRPQGRPFEILVHLVVAEHGTLEVLIDDETVYFNDDIDTRSKATNRPGPSMILGLYQGPDVGVHHLWFNAAVCATTKQEAMDFLDFVDDEPPPPPPECPPGHHWNGQECVPDVIKRGCVIAFLCSSMGLSTLLPWIRQFRSHLPKLTIKSYYSFSAFMLRGVNVKY